MKRNKIIKNGKSNFLSGKTTQLYKIYSSSNSSHTQEVKFTHSIRNKKNLSTNVHLKRILAHEMQA